MKALEITTNEIKKMHPSLLGDVTERTIQHCLQMDLNMPTFKSAYKPFLTRQIVKERIHFAKKHEDWTVEDWRKVLWSDESIFFMSK